MARFAGRVLSRQGRTVAGAAVLGTGKVPLVRVQSEIKPKGVATAPVNGTGYGTQAYGDPTRVAVSRMKKISTSAN